MLPLPLHSTVLCGSIKWPLLLLPWHIQQRWFYDARRRGLRLFSGWTRRGTSRAWSTSPTPISFTRIVFAALLAAAFSPSQHRKVTRRTDTGLVGSTAEHWQVLELDFWRRWQPAAAAAALPQMIEPFELVSSANGALCATQLAECGVWQNTSFQVYVSESFFHCFSVQPHIQTQVDCSTLKKKNTRFGFPWKSLYYALDCSVLQNRDAYSFSLAVFSQFCHFAGESSQCTCTQCFSPRFDVTE